MHGSAALSIARSLAPKLPLLNFRITRVDELSNDCVRKAGR